METTQRSMSTSLLLALVLIGSAAYVTGQYLSSPSRVADENREITVTGEGEAKAQSNIAVVTVGVSTEPQSSADTATSTLAEKMNAVLKVLKDEGLEDKDFEQSDFSVQPQYDYLDGRQQLKGYIGSQNVRVRIEDTNKVGDIISKTTGAGANQIGNVTFEVGEDIERMAEAEAAAIEDAKEKAQKLADVLGVRLGKVKAYSNSGQQTPPMPFLERAVANDQAQKAVPEIPTTNQNFKQTVTVTFEID